MDKNNNENDGPPAEITPPSMIPKYQGSSAVKTGRPEDPSSMSHRFPPGTLGGPFLSHQMSWSVLLSPSLGSSGKAGL